MPLNLGPSEVFASRHIGPNPSETQAMLAAIGCDSVEQLIQKTVPASIKLPKALNIPALESEAIFLEELKGIAKKNLLFKSYIGTGYYPCLTPHVILRNILENPGWYTAYTPYQAEIAQGRLEALINFQTVVTDLTGLEIANASLLDEATAAAEAMAMLYTLTRDDKPEAQVFFASDKCHPQTLDVLRTRSTPLGITLEIGEVKNFAFGKNIFGVLLQYPDTEGMIFDAHDFCNKAHAEGIKVGFACDLLSLTMLKSPGEMGADVAIGSAQRFGVPMGYGGPHAAFFATRLDFRRFMPGRIIGVSVDVHGHRAYRMALQTREQHIRRDKATSNICTSQVLLAVMAGMYAVYHGPQGLLAKAERVHGLTRALAAEVEKLGCQVMHAIYFDTLKIILPAGKQVQFLQITALNAEMNFRYYADGAVGISLDETSSLEDIVAIVEVFAKALEHKAVVADEVKKHIASIRLELNWPKTLCRQSTYLTHRVFNSFHSETEMLRYIKRLENKDLSLNTSMIPLGSCTMKLNATAEMLPVTWPEFGALHPFVPANQALGYRDIFDSLENALAEITGLPGVSLQPNAGSQGEYAGLMVIRAYHHNRNEAHRDVVLIPSSAHGTNPATASMVGLKVVVVKCDVMGNIDVTDLEAKVSEYASRLCALMVTYPSTHGVFEEAIVGICKTIHEKGGQVYMDGANMNAQVGLCSPATIGADVCHLNLHKTFCIPHGGGGPGMGPICAAAHLKPFLPGHAVVKTGGEKAITAISAAPWGSASILLISWAYIRLMGGANLRRATAYAILNANYIKARLQQAYPVLYEGKNGTVAHEMILDCRAFKSSAGVEVEDIAKRLIDYGYHAPTVSFPVPGTLMIEPTESENQAELDRFCESMLSIRAEIRDIEDGRSDKADNVLKNAPHTAQEALVEEWKHAYSREKAVFPLAWVKAFKFWPSVGRLNNAYGDKNLVCACPPIESYM